MPAQIGQLLEPLGGQFHLHEKYSASNEAYFQAISQTKCKLKTGKVK